MSRRKENARENRRKERERQRAREGERDKGKKKRTNERRIAMSEEQCGRPGIMPRTIYHGLFVDFNRFTLYYFALCLSTDSNSREARASVASCIRI